MTIEIPKDIADMNREILDELNADGVDLSEEYTIEHHFSSRNFNDLEKFAVDLYKEGFDVLDADEIEENRTKIFCFDALIDSVISEENLMEQQTKIFTLLNKYHVTYDGWGVDVEFDDE